MKQDLINQTLKTYFLSKGKTLKVIQRYLRVKYNLNIEEKLLKKRLREISPS
ncbi:hypothetical protein QWY93_05235 [Echinicola jeungdonensis]|uniref:Uncharacterized protein n=1 Tax=Echinicola jeungdonensis TaxID=709343 RepID=A0ABV5J4L9_9BACT|nr:hypothetical protein [Echinicola jeungdonensis]MDN3668728.1 hypothetical protein [Echinicola jeungdonensis]